MNTIVEARQLSKWFGEAVAVNNLDLTIGPGITGLLGPNGAGKTTFIKLALGLYRPSRGRILVFGEEPRNNPRVLGRVGNSPDTDNLPGSMTGYEFLYWMNRLWGMTAREAKRAAERVCGTVGMTERMHDLIGEYSLGMRQRIKIGQALAAEPDLLFLDEPMSGLDPKGREEMFALIRSLGETGRSVIVSSHVLHEVERVTSEVVVLHNGRILAQGPVQHIRELIEEHPRTVTVECASPRWLAARFLGDVSTLRVTVNEGAFTAETTDLDGFCGKLNDLVVRQRAKITGIRCVDENLQSVFDYLVK
jgi:ABC-2 type transport system ATP-binding protein